KKTPGYCWSRGSRSNGTKHAKVPQQIVNTYSVGLMKKTNISFAAYRRRIRTTLLACYGNPVMQKTPRYNSSNHGRRFAAACATRACSIKRYYLEAPHF